jgi:uncharacterized protein YjiS (DUF1127 family)
MANQTGGVLGALVSRFAEWRRREAARAELQSLDDRTLADIGLRRSDIPFVLDGGYPPVEREIGARPSFAANANDKSRVAA